MKPRRLKPAAGGQQTQAPNNVDREWGMLVLPLALVFSWSTVRALVSRFRSSQKLAEPSHANFGFGALARPKPNSNRPARAAGSGFASAEPKWQMGNV
jgi:hypothetical protein